jgi:Flp pilus assembly protein TadG
MRLLMIEKLIESFRQCWTARSSGAVAVELAITAPLLIALLLGAVDYGMLMNSEASLVSATRAGGEIAKSTPTVTASQLTSLGLFPSGATPAVSAAFCTCFDDTAVTCPASGTAATNPCAAKTDTRVLRYVTVSGTSSISPLFAWTGFPTSLTASAVVRTQ